MVGKNQLCGGPRSICTRKREGVRLDSGGVRQAAQEAMKFRGPDDGRSQEGESGLSWSTLM